MAYPSRTLKITAAGSPKFAALSAPAYLSFLNSIYIEITGWQVNLGISGRLNKMRIDIWSDYACPFCYIGKRRLENALRDFPGRDEVEVVFRSFELDPHAKVLQSGDIHSKLAEKYGMTRERAKEMNAQLGAQAKEEGLDFRFDSIISTNTFDAHRLGHYAREHGKAAEMTERLLQAYFTDGSHLGKKESLAELAAEVGLDKQDVLYMLAGNAFTEAVRQDEEEARRLGITGVPFFVVNGKYGVSGAQPLAVFKDVLNTVWAEEHRPQQLQRIGNAAPDGDGCGDGSCSV